MRPQLQTVDYVSGSGDRLRGYAGSSDLPAAMAVVLFPDVMGIREHIHAQAARVLAAGFDVFIADMYGGGRAFTAADEAFASRDALLSEPQLLQDRAAAAVSTLSSIGRDPAMIAAAGYCFGGQVALELARSGAPLKAAVSFHGELLPLGSALSSPSISVLSYSGGADPFIPPEMVSTFRSEAEAAGCPWQIVVDGGVGHAFTDPGANAMGIPGVAYDRRADHLSFALMRELLADLVAQEAPGRAD
ncbi:dienelactone hydrolase family protein [Angustibacter luteus]|uniref:Dienelactone hydrolase family protein n=1 Tax=Angustibacter luteus TaxID=658456 RepID=A0ABW1JEU1_9ACTN